MARIILASSSPRRKKLLQSINLEFEIIKPQVEEVKLPSAKETVLHNAKIKAESVAYKYPKAIIIAADTIVNLDNKIIGKPKSIDEAKSMLTTLSNRWHKVMSGVCIIAPKYYEIWLNTAEVLFAQLSPETVNQYVEIVNPLDKAGSYNIAEQRIKIIKNIRGEKSTIMGLPIEEIKVHLSKLNILP